MIGREYDDFLQDCPVTFERVDKGYYAEYLGHALLLYRKAEFRRCSSSGPLRRGPGRGLRMPRRVWSAGSGFSPTPAVR